MGAIVLAQREHGGLYNIFLIRCSAGSSKVIVKKRFDISETES